MAASLELIAKGGRDAFYKGPIANAIGEDMAKRKGLLTAADMAAHTSDWTEPISTTYKGYDVLEFPPNTQGAVALEMLNILEVCVPKLGFNLTALGPSDPMYWHLMVEAKKIAYSDLLAKNADPKFAKVPVAELISKDHAAKQCGRINPNVAGKPGVAGGTDGGTIYLTTADRWGNMVSLVHSVFSVYGSRATVGPYGFVLHNRGSAFSLDPKSPNLVAPGKQPFHSIIAGFVMKDGRPLMAFGNCVVITRCPACSAGDRTSTRYSPAGVRCSPTRSTAMAFNRSFSTSYIRSFSYNDCTGSATTLGSGGNCTVRLSTAPIDNGELAGSAERSVSIRKNASRPD